MDQHPATSGGAGETRRIVDGWTATAERRALAWLAPRVPDRVTSDHLTLLGFVSTAAAGAFYAASGHEPRLLLLVNLALLLNWLGDSLDGTLARFRGLERPRFGYYVDHVADAFGALFMLVGLALSGLMHPLVAAAVLVAYFLLAIETYLAAHTIGAFKISWGGIGGTELRILLAGVNLAALAAPVVEANGHHLRLFDLAGAAAAAGLLIVSVVASVRGLRLLAAIEGWAPAATPRAAGPGDSSGSVARRSRSFGE